MRRHGREPTPSCAADGPAPTANGGRGDPVPRGVRGDVRASAPRPGGAVLPRPQHDGDSGEPRRGRRGGAGVPADGLRDAGVPARGVRLPWRTVQFGDPRRNRTAFGWRVGEDWVSLLDEDEPRDPAARDAFYARLGGIQLGGTSAPVLTLRLVRAMVTNPGASLWRQDGCGALPSCPHPRGHQARSGTSIVVSYGSGASRLVGAGSTPFEPLVLPGERSIARRRTAQEPWSASAAPSAYRGRCAGRPRRG